MAAAELPGGDESPGDLDSCGVEFSGSLGAGALLCSAGALLCSAGLLVGLVTGRNVVELNAATSTLTVASNRTTSVPLRCGSSDQTCTGAVANERRDLGSGPIQRVSASARPVPGRVRRLVC